MILVFSGPTTKRRKVETQVALEESIIGKLFLNFPCIEVPRYIGRGYSVLARKGVVVQRSKHSCG